jgi:hypothetical protein
MNSTSLTIRRPTAAIAKAAPIGIPLIRATMISVPATETTRQ